MPTAKDIYFSKSEINLKRKVYLQRKYKVPISNGWTYQEYDKIYSSNWSTYSTATGVSFSNDKAIFNNVSDGGIKGKFGAVGSSPTIDNTKNAYIKVTIEVENYMKGTLLLAYGTVTDVGNTKFVKDPTQTHIYYALVCTQSIMPNTNFYLYSNDGFTGDIVNGGAEGAKLYEDSWVDISDFLIPKSLSTNKQLDYKSWEFGEVQQDNMKLSFINENGSLSDESNENSLFYNGYIKHQSKIKFDLVLDSESTTIFEGLIDERSCSSETVNSALIKENIVVFSYCKLLSNITLAEIGAITSSETDTILKAVNVIIGYGGFRYFMPITDISIDRSITVDLSQYDPDQTISDIFKELSKGHAAFWVETDNTFCFKTVTPNDTVIEYGVNPERKIKIYEYSAGADRLIENFYWEGSTEKYITRTPKYNTSEKVNVSAITDSTSRQNLLNALGANFASKRKTLKLDVPIAPFINIFDVVRITNKNKIGVTEFNNTDFIIYGISHHDTVTTLTLVEKKNSFYLEDTNIRTNTHVRVNIYDDYVPYNGIYNFVLKGEAGMGNGNYDQARNSARGAIGTLKLRLSTTNKLTVKCIAGGNAFGGGADGIPKSTNHGGCGIAVFVDDVLVCAIGGGGAYYSSNSGVAIWMGGGGYRGGDSYAVYYSTHEPSPSEYAGYGYNGLKNERNTSVSELASGGSIHSNYYGYGGSGYIKLDSEYLEEFSYINGSNTEGINYLTPDGNSGQGFASIEYAEE